MLFAWTLTAVDDVSMLMSCIAMNVCCDDDDGADDAWMTASTTSALPTWQLSTTFNSVLTTNGEIGHLRDTGEHCGKPTNDIRHVRY